MKPETVIYALPQRASERYTEQIVYAGGRKLTQNEIDRVIAAASADGWHSFRVATFDDTPPVFGANLLARR